MPSYKTKILVLAHNPARESSVAKLLQSYHLDLIERNVNSAHLVVDDLYDMVIVDENDAASSLVEVCADLRQQVAAPLVLVTHSRDEDGQVRAYGVGVDECVVKPISGALLYAKLIRWLRWSNPGGRKPSNTPAPSVPVVYAGSVGG